jgi:hypothetical protein
MELVKKASKRYAARQNRDAKTVSANSIRAAQVVPGRLKSDSVLHPLTGWPSLFFSTFCLMRVNL